MPFKILVPIESSYMTSY